MSSLADRMEDRLGDGESEGGWDERRQYQRWSFREPNVLFIVDHPGGGTSRSLVHTRNLSSHGASLLHDGFLHMGSTCRIALKRRDGEQVTIRGVICQCRHVKQTVHELGVRFDRAVDPTAYLTLDAPDDHGELDEIEPRHLRGRVLHADDFAADRRLLAHHLRETGIRLTSVGTFAECLQKVAKEPFDIVMCDIRLEGHDAVELLPRIRETGFLGAIVLLTAETDPARLKKAREVGVASHLPKPFMPEQLMSHLTLLHKQLGAAIPPRWTLSTLEDQPGMTDLIKAFITDARAASESVSEAVRSGDLQLVRDRCLSLKGSADGHGFAHLSTAAAEAVKTLDSTLSITESATQIKRMTLLAETITTAEVESAAAEAA